ncbi:hypothetical protein [Ralstonia pickettii]|nr:hypothetical protein [Ralstonia pickettii]
MANVGKLKEGSLFGATDGVSWLYCKVAKFDGSVIYARVINGAWTARFNTDGTVDAIGSWDRIMNEGIKGLRIAFTDELPEDVRDDYNASIDYMDAQMAKNPVSRYMAGRLLGMRLRVARLMRASRAAKNAFAQAWSPKPAALHADADEEEDEDSIPF